MHLQKDILRFIGKCRVIYGAIRLNCYKFSFFSRVTCARLSVFPVFPCVQVLASGQAVLPSPRSFPHFPARCRISLTIPPVHVSSEVDELSDLSERGSETSLDDWSPAPAAPVSPEEVTARLRAARDADRDRYLTAARLTPRLRWDDVGRTEITASAH